MRDITHFVTLDKDGFITGQHAGDFKADFSETPYSDQERVKIPRGVRFRINDKLSYYDEDFKRKTDKQLIDEGLITLPNGYKLLENHIVKMTQIERYIEGLDELPEGMKLVDDKLIPMTPIERIQIGLDEMPNGMRIVNDELILMTIKDQLEAGQLTQSEYDQKIFEQNKQNLINKLETIDKESGTGRTVRKAAVDMGDMLKVVRKAAVDMGDMLKVVRKTAMDFGDMAKTLGVPGFDPNENEALQALIHFDPNENEALQTLIIYDPAENTDLQKINKWEQDAEEIREQLRQLTVTDNS